MTETNTCTTAVSSLNVSDVNSYVLISVHVVFVILIIVFFIFKIVDCILKRKRRSLERSSAYRRFRQPTPSALGDLTPSPTVLDLTPSISNVVELGTSRELATILDNNAAAAREPNAITELRREEQGHPLFSSRTSIPQGLGAQPLKRESNREYLKKPKPRRFSKDRSSENLRSPVPHYRRSVSQGIQTDTLPRQFDPKNAVVLSSQHWDVVRSIIGSECNATGGYGEIPEGLDPGVVQSLFRSWPDSQCTTPSQTLLTEKSATKLKRFEKNGTQYTMVDMRGKTGAASDTACNRTDDDGDDDDDEAEEGEEMVPKLPHSMRDAKERGDALQKRKSFKIVKPAQPDALGRSQDANTSYNGNQEMDIVISEGAVGYSEPAPRLKPRSSSLQDVIEPTDNSPYYSMPPAPGPSSPHCRVTYRNREHRMTLYDEVAMIQDK